MLLEKPHSGHQHEEYISMESLGTCINLFYLTGAAWCKDTTCYNYFFAEGIKNTENIPNSSIIMLQRQVPLLAVTGLC